MNLTTLEGIHRWKEGNGNLVLIEISTVFGLSVISIMSSLFLSLPGKSLASKLKRSLSSELDY